MVSLTGKIKEQVSRDAKEHFATFSIQGTTSLSVNGTKRSELTKLTNAYRLYLDE